MAEVWTKGLHSPIDSRVLDNQARKILMQAIILRDYRRAGVSTPARRSALNQLDALVTEYVAMMTQQVLALDKEGE